MSCLRGAQDDGTLVVQTRRAVLNTETVSAQWSVPVDASVATWTANVSVTCTDCADDSGVNALCKQYVWAPTDALRSSCGFSLSQTIGTVGGSMSVNSEDLFPGLGAFTMVSNPKPQTPNPKPFQATPHNKL